MIESRRAFGLRQRDPGETKLSRLFERVARKAPRLIKLLGKRLHFRVGKFANRLLQQLLFFGEFQVHSSDDVFILTCKALRACFRTGAVCGRYEPSAASIRW